MQSLLWSLKALDARIVAQLPLYARENPLSEEGQLINLQDQQLVLAALELLEGEIKSPDG